MDERTEIVDLVVPIYTPSGKTVLYALDEIGGKLYLTKCNEVEYGEPQYPVTDIEALMLDPLAYVQRLLKEEA